jgi:hypothetical protein
MFIKPSSDLYLSMVDHGLVDPWERYLWKQIERVGLLKPKDSKRSNYLRKRRVMTKQASQYSLTSA